MKTILFVAGMSIAFAGCTTSGGQQTAWGKAGVSRTDYGTDIGMCTGLAAMQSAGSGANTAGGVSGKNAPSQTDAAPGSESSMGSRPGGTDGGAPQQNSSNLPATGTYSGMASADYAQRAAMQQRTQEMQVKRLQAETYKDCLVDRGYREYTLTPEQRAKLATFKVGSDQYHEYLFSLGTDAGVITAQSKK